MKYIIAFSLLLITNIVSGQTWEVVGPATLTSGNNTNFQDIVIGNDGYPVVCYADELDSNRTVVKKYNGTNWVNLGNPNFWGIEKKHQQIQKDSLGNIYVSHFDFLDSNKVYVYKFDGTSWAQLGNGPVSSPPLSLLATGNFSKFLVFKGEPYVAYQDSYNGGHSTVKKYNGTTWEIVGSAGFSTVPTYIFDMETDGTYLYLLMAGNSLQSLLMRFDSTWTNVGPIGITGTGGGGTLTFLDTVPYVAYDYSNSTAVKKYDGTSWVLVGQANISNGLGQYRDFLNHDGELIMVYKRSGVTFKTFNGSSWVTHTIVGMGNHTSITSHNGVLYLAYSSQFDGYKTKVMKYGTPLTNNFNIESKELDFKLYPNPTTSSLNIQTSALVESIEIYSIQGQLVQQEQTTNFSVQDLPAGTYLVKVISEEGLGTQIFVKK